MRTMHRHSPRATGNRQPATSSGYTLIEILTVIVIMGTIFVIVVPAFAEMRRRMALRAASSELRAIFHLARMRAITRGRNCGLKFATTSGQWRFAIYDDGDGDGVRNDDIAKGIDKLVHPPRVILRESRIVTIGLLSEKIKDPDGDPLPPTKSPVHFNSSAICSFSPLGESTPGTIYITDRNRGLWCVRVYGASAKVRTLRWDPDAKRWLS